MAGCKCCEGSCGKDVRVSFCPKCKSRRVGYVFGLGNLFGVIPKMNCRDCGFSAPTFPVLVANKAELEKAVGALRGRRSQVVGRRSTGATVKKIKKKAVKKKAVKKK